MIEKIKNLPKIELHLHLDGSISLELASKLSGLRLEEVKSKMIARDKCENLSEYLTKFDFPIQLMQTKENLTLIAKDLVDRLAAQKVLYAEIRFAPMFHIHEGLTYEAVVEAVLDGFKMNTHIQTNLILCMMRGMPRENNLKTMEVAEKYLNRGVCAIDLAGAEDKYPLEEYLDLFEIARSRGIPFTIHAGENGSADEVRKAIEVGATRIGHGIHAMDSEAVVNFIKAKKILLEVCPTSNVQTNAVSQYQEHPIQKMYRNNLAICINTDNTTVSNISITEEYLKLFQHFNFMLDDYKDMNIYAIQSSFLSLDKKRALLEEYEEKYLSNKDGMVE